LPGKSRRRRLAVAAAFDVDIIDFATRGRRAVSLNQRCIHSLLQPHPRRIHRPTVNYHQSDCISQHPASRPAAEPIRLAVFERLDL